VAGLAFYSAGNPPKAVRSLRDRAGRAAVPDAPR
jgi:hypothetical protein